MTYSPVTTALYVNVVSSEPAIDENVSTLPEADAKRTCVKEIQEPQANRRRITMERLSGSKKITIIYCAIIFVAAVAWLILGSKSHGSLSIKKGRENACLDIQSL